jgi:putative intracellular protease/amidase
MDLNGKKCDLATHGIEQADLEVPRDRFTKARATVDVFSLAGGRIKGWDKKAAGERGLRRRVRCDRPAGRPDQSGLALTGRWASRSGAWRRLRTWHISMPS